MTTKILDGLPFPAFFPEENYHVMKNMPLRDNDLVIVTYPKCGTNWVAYIVQRMYKPDEPAPHIGSSVFNYCAFVDGNGLGDWKNSPEDEGRILVTHLPLDYLQTNPKTKFLAVVRNPLDCCASFFHFFKTQYTFQKTDQEIPNEFFEDFMKGDVIYGEFFKHLKGLYERRNDPNFHLVVFEELKSNPRDGILNLAKFLGKDKKLTENNYAILDQIVEQSSFSTMKKSVSYARPDGKDMNMLRKGEAGGYKNSLTVDQIQALKNKMETELAGTEILNYWRNI